MEKFEWNNFLHIKIQQFFTTVLSVAKPYYRLSLFEKCGLLDHLIDLMQQKDFQMPSSKNAIRRGYIGFLINISNKIIECSIKDTLISAHLNSSKRSY